MTIDPNDDAEREPPPRRRPTRAQPPAFNVPGVVLATILAFVAVHILRDMILGPIAEGRLLLNFAFIPGCYLVEHDLCLAREGGALLWSPLSHAFLHGDWTHLIANTVWLLAFGTPVARRLGTGRFVLFSAFGACAGAALFDLMNPTLLEPVIGASGVVSALMGGACRFAFASTGSTGRPNMHRATFAPLLPIGRALADRTVLFFIIAFFATNLVVGSGVGDFLGAGGQVAWEAHLGGFIFGFLFFRLFDPVRPDALRASSRDT